MATYATEEIQRLNASLLELQRAHLCSSMTVTTLPDISCTPRQAWESGNRTQFLLAANHSLDASLAGMPRMDDMDNYLTWYLSLENKQDNNAANDTTLEWLFITKCTLAVYGHNVSSILQSTLPLSESLAYWDSIYGNTWHEVYYGIQSAPVRLYHLIANTWQVFSDSSSSPSFKIKNLITSSDHILSCLFPMALRDNGSDSNIKQQRPSDGQQQQQQHHHYLYDYSRTHRHHLRHPGKSLVHVFRKLYNLPLPLALVRDEIQQKRTTLRLFRARQATTLGLLIKQVPHFVEESLERTNRRGSILGDGDSLLSAATATSRAPTEEEQAVSLHQVACGTTQCVKALTSCLLGGDGNHMQSITSLDDLQQRMNWQATLDDIERSRGEFTMTSTSPYNVAKDLKQLVDLQPTYQHYLQVWKQNYGPPSSLSRYWLPGLVALFAGKMTMDYVFERKEDIVAWANEGMTTIREFLVHWLWEPTKGILDTIRFQDRRIGLSSKEGLKSDLQSLERMVIQFAKDHYQFSNAQANQLLTQVRDGDISQVLLAYENEIKHPLRNAIQGDLIQTLLIQVQKTKVDMDMAMQALDKLLKSNELNFAFLAVAPSMLLTWAFVSWLKNVYQKRDGNRIRQIGRPLKNTLRRIDRLFTLDPDGNELTCESQGVLLCELLLLRNYAQYLPTRNSIRELFIEDIRDLETVRLSKMQKKETIGRMYRSWKFLY
ncbi:ATP synthase regulation protein NCA2-domain-containing protein [Absidia repens]|uniref:ATP synthase regulation protein NCA2-domain-containing protein n=1 Tax=Absidia repens TaxID=90262 RepID=A0A1X2I461_9FUNG|nr:ATP synthase regulation protein NCA2-domain-containing protein [Absidia repens]